MNCVNKQCFLPQFYFPFSQAREKARQTSCLSNVKQLGTACQLYTDYYANEFSAIKDIKVVFSSKVEEFLSQIVKENYKLLPKGFYVLKTDYYDGDTLIYSNSVNCMNMKVLEISFEDNVLKCKFDFTAFKEPKVSMITLSQGEKVFMGGSFYNNNQFERIWDLSAFPKGEYELSVNILGVYKEIQKIIKE